MRAALRTSLGFALLLAVGACADAPTAPQAAVTGGPSDGQPAEVQATPGTLVTLAPLSGFGAGGVTAINNKRETAGWNYTTGTVYHAFYRSATGAMTDLGTLGGTGSIALAMNDSASIVGLSYASATTYHAFVSRLVGGVRTMTDLGVLAGGTRSAAYGINAAGTIVGFSYNAAGQQHAVKWTPPAYTPTDLGTLAAGTGSFAYAINAGGTVVGFSTTSVGVARAFSWTSAGGMVDLGTLGGNTSTARSINDAGDIVGWSTTAAGVTHAWKRTAAGVSTDLGSPNGGSSFAFDISTAGKIIGWARPASGPDQALLWSGGVTNDLGALTATGWAQSLAMNDSGNVVGTSNDQSTIWYLNTNRAPTASFTATTGRTNGTAVTVNASASKDADGDQITYAWTFDDGATATGVTASHVFTTTAFHKITLVVSDWRGGTATTSKNALVF